MELRRPGPNRLLKLHALRAKLVFPDPVSMTVCPCPSSVLPAFPTTRGTSLPVRSRRGQPPEIRRHLRRHNAEPRQMPPQRVNRPSALANQKIASAEQHPPGLPRLRLHGHETRCRTLRRLADRLGVRRIVLLPLRERLYIDRHNQPDPVPELQNLPTQIMRARARLHGHQATRLEATNLSGFARLIFLRNNTVPSAVAPCN